MSSPRFKIPTPPARLRRGPLREGAFHSALHDERTTSLIGTALGVAFATAFVTGLISHELQHPASWFPLPTRPVWFYRFTQGLHVATGLASIPLLLAKLWTVYPKLFAWPPVKSVLHGLERLSILVLISGAVFELVTGLLNVVQWYPWGFDFTQTHFWVAWLTVGALILHIAVKAPAIARGLTNKSADGSEEGAQPPAGATAWAALTAAAAGTETETEVRTGTGTGTGEQPEPTVQAAPAAPDRRGTVSRRAMLTTTGIAVGVVTATTVGQSISSLHAIDLFAPRSPQVGPQGLPINRTAAQAQVAEAALDPQWRLSVAGPRPFTLSLADLAAMPQYTADLPISCVEGWSVNATWQGVRMVDLLARVGAPAGSQVRIVSLERSGAYATTQMPHEYADDPLTLLALKLRGEPLALDHGFPARIIAPARPGVLQTKWVSRIEVM
ncbi:MAG TPA: molybdopterin-dependent oxidoreductase [Actinocrinis sp.]|nr:molybdopterin-dependent oxidoreductase [Actinocrinis sp.]